MKKAWQSGRIDESFDAEYELALEEVRMDEMDRTLSRKWQSGAKEIRDGNIRLVRAKNHDTDVNLIYAGSRQIGNFSLDTEGSDFWIVNLNKTKGQKLVDHIEDIVALAKKNMNESFDAEYELALEEVMMDEGVRKALAKAGHAVMAGVDTYRAHNINRKLAFNNTLDDVFGKNRDRVMTRREARLRGKYSSLVGRAKGHAAKVQAEETDPEFDEAYEQALDEIVTEDMNHHIGKVHHIEYQDGIRTHFIPVGIAKNGQVRALVHRGGKKFVTEYLDTHVVKHDATLTPHKDIPKAVRAHPASFVDGKPISEDLEIAEARQKGSVDLTKMSHRKLSERFDKVMNKHSELWGKTSHDTGTRHLRYSELMAKGDDFHPYIPKMKALMNHRDEIEREMKRRYGTSDFTVGRFKTYMAKT